MSSNLEIRICTLNKRVTAGRSETHGGAQINPVGDASELAAALVALEFDGALITSDLTELRANLQALLNAGFPGTDLLVIGAAPGLSADATAVAAQRAVAVKKFLLEAGVPAVNVAADAP